MAVADLVTCWSTAKNVGQQIELSADKSVGVNMVLGSPRWNIAATFGTDRTTIGLGSEKALGCDNWCRYKTRT